MRGRPEYIQRRTSSVFRNFLLVVIVLGIIFLLFSVYSMHFGRTENFQAVESLQPPSKAKEHPREGSKKLGKQDQVEEISKPSKKEPVKKAEKKPVTKGEEEKHKSRVFVLTYANKQLGLPGPKVSADALGISIKIDLVDVPYTTHVQKMESADRYITYLLKPKAEGGGGAHEKDILFFVDFFDTFLCCSEEDIVKNFESYGKEVISSAETNCYPEVSVKELYNKYIPNPPTRFKYPNSGVYIGYLGSIRKMYDDIVKRWGSFDQCAHIDAFGKPAIVHSGGKDLKDYNDQRCYNSYFMKILEEGNTDFFGIDYYGRVCSSLHEQKLDDYQWSAYDHVINKITDSKTCAFHGNGGGKDAVDMAFNTVYGVDKWLFERNMNHKRGTVDRLRKRDNTKVWKPGMKEY